MIPGYVIAWITFPGVIVHEFAHMLFCRLFGLKVYDVCYMRFAVGGPSGYVIHERSKRPYQDIVIAVGPFLVNTIIGLIVAAPAVVPLFRFGDGDFLDCLIAWLGISIAMHSFPSTGDAASIWRTVTHGSTSWPWKVVGTPIVGLIYLGALGSVLWLDLIYGVAVAAVLPILLVRLLA